VETCVAEPSKLQKLVKKTIQESELPRTLIAKDAEVSRAAVEAWHSGNRNPSVESAAQLAAGLEKRASHLQYLAFRLRNGLESGD
jgi:transcriptional regulator with XRE-family HTH domain